MFVVRYCVVLGTRGLLRTDRLQSVDLRYRIERKGLFFLRLLLLQLCRNLPPLPEQ